MFCDYQCFVNMTSDVSQVTMKFVVKVLTKLIDLNFLTQKWVSVIRNLEGTQTVLKNLDLLCYVDVLCYNLNCQILIHYFLIWGFCLIFITSICYVKTFCSH